MPKRADASTKLFSPTPEQALLTSPSIISHPLPSGVIVFASGMNRIADIRGAEAAGVPIGVDVSRLSARAIDELLGSRVPVLLDSGAFSEVSIQYGRVCVRSEISDCEWVRRLAVYRRVAEGRFDGRTKHNVVPPVSVVAPDRVGSQDLTLARLSKYRAETRRVYFAGAEVLVPLQVGPHDLLRFYNSAKTVLGIEIVPAFPMKKAATTIQSILDFIQGSCISRIHLLGIGADNRNAEPIIRLIQHSRPGTRISMDSNRLRAAVGTDRIITRKEEQYGDDLVFGWTGEVDLSEWGGSVHDMTEMLYQPSVWLSGSRLQETAESLTWFASEQKREFLNDPDSFVNFEKNQSGWLDQVLMQAYFSCLRQQVRGAARTRAVAETLSRSKIGRQVL